MNTSCSPSRRAVRSTTTSSGIRRSPLSGTDPDNPYRYLEIRGTVVRVDDDSSNQFIDSMAKKYMGVDEYPMHQPGDHRVVMVVMPTHTTKMG